MIAHTRISSIFLCIFPFLLRPLYSLSQGKHERTNTQKARVLDHGTSGHKTTGVQDPWNTGIAASRKSCVPDRNWIMGKIVFASSRRREVRSRPFDFFETLQRVTDATYRTDR